MTLLKERYGDTQKLTDAHMQALVELKSPNHTLNSLQLFYDSIESHIRSLQSLGTPPEMYESMLVPTILTKLPAEIRRTLAWTHGTEKWTLKDLRSCLLQELRILDVGADYTTGHQVPTAAFSTSVNHKLTSKQHNPQSVKKSCIFCKSPSHSATKCEVIPDVSKRVEVVKKENLCFNCLGHHKISQCQSKYRCKSCGRKHHTSLCDAKTTSQTLPTDTTSTTTTSATATKTDTKTQLLAPVVPMDNSTHNLVSPGTAQCLLKTAVVDVRAGRNRCSANILFDEGAQQSFISQELADQLSVCSEGSATTSISSFGGASTLSMLQSTSIKLIPRTGEEIPLSVLIVPKIATPLKIQV